MHLHLRKALPGDSCISKHAIHILEQCYGCYSLNKLPAAQPVSITNSILESIHKDSYLASEKIDGLRYMLVISSCPDPYAVLIDRRLHCFPVPVMCHKSHFHGSSVFDAELALETQIQTAKTFRILFLFDVLLDRGTVCMKESFPQRFERLQNIFGDYNASTEGVPYGPRIVSMGLDPLILFRPKKWHTCSNLDVLVRRRQRLPYKTDGFIFMPISSPIQRGQQENMYKWKLNHTIDLLFDCIYDSQRGSYAIALLANDKGAPRHLDELALVCDNMTMLLELQQSPQMDSLLSYCHTTGHKEISFVGECDILPLKEEEEKIVPIQFRKVRFDKDEPNDISILVRNLSSSFSQAVPLEVLLRKFT